MRKFVFDCDTGTDDAIAILAVFGTPDIEILGITSVNGNVTENHVSANNLDLCEYLGFDVPVTRGASMPLFSGYHNSLDMTHGTTGLGSVVLPHAQTKQFDPRIASRFLFDMAVKCEGELELFVTGPMTNIALAVIQYPEFSDLIKHIYFMGRAVWGGNVTTTAEFNIWADPEAAHIVFDSGIPMTMVGLDVTLKAIMEKEDVVKLRACHTKAADFAADLLDFMFDCYSRGGEDVIMHDALAVASALCPECMKYTDYFVDVETTGTYTRGHTAADFRGRLGKEPNMACAMELDVPMFRKWLVERISACGKSENH